MPRGRPQLERDFVTDFKAELDAELPGGFWTKGNSAFRSGVPDDFFFWHTHWAALEFKRSGDAAKQTHQDFYVDKLGEMSYAAFVTPDNYHEVIDEIKSAFGA